MIMFLKSTRSFKIIPEWPQIQILCSVQVSTVEKCLILRTVQNCRVLNVKNQYAPNVNNHIMENQNVSIKTNMTTILARLTSISVLSAAAK